MTYRPYHWTLPIAAVALLVSACGGSDNADSSSSSSSEPNLSATSTPTEVASADTAPSENPAANYDTEWEVVAPKIPSDAAGVFGADEVQEAVDLVVNLVQDHTYNDESTTTKAGTRVDEFLYSIGDSMTPSSRRDFERNAKAFLRDATTGSFGSSEGSQNIITLSLYGALTEGSSGLDGEVVGIYPDGPVWFDKSIKKIGTFLEDDGRLTVEVSAVAMARFLLDDEPTVWGPHKRNLSFYLLSTNGQWQIDGYRGEWTTGKFRPER